MIRRMPLLPDSKERRFLAFVAAQERINGKFQDFPESKNMNELIRVCILKGWIHKPTKPGTVCGGLTPLGYEAMEIEQNLRQPPRKSEP